jgi:phage baseplate assembly protein W
MAAVDIPQYSLPLRIVGGQFAVVEQGTIDEVRDQVEVLIRTPRGSRLDLPDFGIDDPTFRSEPDLDEIRDAIETYAEGAVVHIDSEIDLETTIRQINVGVAADA